ncbi:hypothetical protein N7501_003258, partial [Penicillium viridicatum]
KRDVSNASPPDDPESGEQGRKRKPLSFFLAFIALLLMVFLVSLDTTTLAVAIPANISFIVAVVVIQPIYPSFSGIFSRKIPLYAAFTLFGIGSIVFAVVYSIAVLIIGRVLQGLGGGGLDVLTIYLETPLKSSISILLSYYIVFVFIGIAAFAIDFFYKYLLFDILISLTVRATIFSSVFANRIEGIVLPTSLALLNDPSEAMSFIPYLRTADISPALQDLIRNTIWYELAAFGALGLLSSLFVNELTMETEELGRQHFEHESD